jgi:hypothetical protein
MSVGRIKMLNKCAVSLLFALKEFKVFPRFLYSFMSDTSGLIRLNLSLCKSIMPWSCKGHTLWTKALHPGDLSVSRCCRLTHGKENLIPTDRRRGWWGPWAQGRTAPNQSLPLYSGRPGFRSRPCLAILTEFVACLSFQTNAGIVS